MRDRDDDDDRDEHGEFCSRCRKRRHPRRRFMRGDTLVFGVQVRLRQSVSFDDQVVYCAACDPSAVVVNITGWLLWCTGKRSVSDPDQVAVAQVTSTPTSVPAGGGIAIVSAISGQALVTIPAIATRGFPDGVVRLPYDVQGKDPAGAIWTVERGVWEVHPDVTNAIG